MIDVINLIISGILDCFNKLASFEFLGTNMLKFMLTLMLLGTILPLLLSITSFRTVKTRKEKRNDN